jgi:hypothetical protein
MRTEVTKRLFTVDGYYAMAKVGILHETIALSLSTEKSSR